MRFQQPRFLTLLILAAAMVLAGISHGSAQAPAKAPAKGAQPKFKAIWEPVNVKEDLELMSVHFASADEGWVAGGKNAMQGGVILHTTDGGANWEIQVGDTASDDRAIRDLYFLDAKTGFAVQGSPGDHQLLRTTDGQNWSQVGTVPEHREDFAFLSPQIGVLISDNPRILRTTDGGRKWQPVYDCKVKAEVDGLTRDVNCAFQRLHFVNATTGYAISRGVGDAGFVLAKTTDGGATWSASLVAPGENGYEGDVHFLDENNGIVRTNEGKILRTSDGGATWTGIPGTMERKSDLEFADANSGWAIFYQKVTYTSNAGMRWSSTATKFPAMVNASSRPAKDRGYVIGNHGMVYRYRIVPVEYNAKGILPAPSM
jgi:photosystem II stability/assembly factor-like uncharacterized protein